MEEPAWLPEHDPNHISVRSNIHRFMQQLGFGSYTELFNWSVTERAAYWQQAIQQVNIHFIQPYHHVLDTGAGVAKPSWLVGARLNIAASCWQANPDQTAIIYQDFTQNLHTISYAQLQILANRIANSLHVLREQNKQLVLGSAIALILPMTVESVALYLGLIQAGYVAVGIADSFAPDEINKRIELSGAKLVFTQSEISRAGKILPLYAKVQEANAPITVVLPLAAHAQVKLRHGDIAWDHFLGANEYFIPVACAPHAHTNILFSSGTTGEPKAIVWDHTSPIKAAVDGYFHQDIQPTDIVAWPSSLGWMMGPWLIYATFINRATMALYYDAPNTQGFTEFVARAKVTILGVVPSLVNNWRLNNYCAGLDWSNIKLFSSTGETSNPADMWFLMQQAGNKPIIEYCGGTEIAGAYITSTVVQPNFPSTFSTPTLGLDFVLISPTGGFSDRGDVGIIPPSIGLSREVLNRDNYEVYYKNMPKTKSGMLLRRHGDQFERLTNGYYRSLGRSDDTMNLGGIKISSAEIESCFVGIEGVLETAAIGIQENGLTVLTVFVVLKHKSAVDLDLLKQSMQAAINKKLNPLFKIHTLKLIDALPRTNSNKIMRRALKAL